MTRPTSSPQRDALNMDWSRLDVLGDALCATRGDKVVFVTLADAEPTFGAFNERVNGGPVRHAKMEVSWAVSNQAALAARSLSLGMPSICRASSGLATSRPSSRTQRTSRSTNWALDFASTPRE